MNKMIEEDKEIKSRINYREQLELKCCLCCNNSRHEMDYEDMDLICNYEESDGMVVQRLDICDNFNK